MYSSHADHQLSFTSSLARFLSALRVLQRATKHESEYVHFEPSSAEEEKPVLQDAKATTPAGDANAAPSAGTPANPTINDVVPMAPLTRADIRTHFDN